MSKEKRKIKINQISLILGMYLLMSTISSCTNCGKVKSLIIQSYEKKSKGEPTIDLKKVFDFEWDTLYIVDGYIDKNYINKYLNIDCGCEYVPDDTFMYLFVKNGKLVKKRIQKCKDFQIQIPQLLGNGGIREINYKNSKFKISKEDKNIDFYVLKPYKRNSSVSN
jgi:hypothetical protein